MRISDWSSDVCSSDLGAAAYSRLRKNALAGANSFGDAPLRRGSPRGTRRTMSGYRSKQRGLGRVGGLVAAALLLGLAACSSDEPPAYVEKPVEELYNGAMNAMPAGEIGRAPLRERACAYV